MARIDEHTMIEGTIADLDSVLETLRAEATALATRITEAEARRDAWRIRLKQLSANATGKERLRKGAALEAINSVFADVLPGIGLSISEIAS